jgi:hypothetical protein
MKAAEQLGTAAETREIIRGIVAAAPAESFVRRVLHRELALPPA